MLVGIFCNIVSLAQVTQVSQGKTVQMARMVNREVLERRGNLDVMERMEDQEKMG